MKHPAFPSIVASIKSHALAVISLIALTASQALAAEYVGRTPPRLSLIDGEVSYFRRGGDGWEQAQLNIPMAPGDYIATGANSRAEGK